MGAGANQYGNGINNITTFNRTGSPDKAYNMQKDQVAGVIRQLQQRIEAYEVRIQMLAQENAELSTHKVEISMDKGKELAQNKVQFETVL